MISASPKHLFRRLIKNDKIINLTKYIQTKITNKQKILMDICFYRTD